jgi:hypothetical protein
VGLLDIFRQSGTFKPDLRAELEGEDIVVLEEGLGGSVRYDHFKAPGKRFNGKVIAERFAVAITERRLAVYCRSGRVKLIDSPFGLERLSAVEPSLMEEDRFAIRIDYDRMPDADAKVSGQITIRARTPKAPLIVEELRARLPKAAAG